MSDCKACGGSGVCGECYGSGKRYDGEPCNYCKGTKTCRTCGGSGKGERGSWDEDAPSSPLGRLPFRPRSGAVVAGEASSVGTFHFGQKRDLARSHLLNYEWVNGGGARTSLLAANGRDQEPPSLTQRHLVG